MEDYNDLELSSDLKKIICKIVWRYQSYFEFDDLYQVACIGIIKAKKNYRPEYNVKFTTYAYNYIIGEVLGYIKNNRTSIKVSGKTYELYKKINSAREILTQKLMKNVTNYEISQFLEIDEKIINDVISACGSIDSLDRDILTQEDFKLYDLYGEKDKSIENYPLRYELENLPDDERNLINLRYYQDMSQREVGKELGMYQVEVARKEKKILKKIYDKVS